MAVNYAPLMVGGMFIIVGLWWLMSAKNTFTGPVRTIEWDEAAGIVEEEPVEPTEPPGAGGLISPSSSRRPRRSWRSCRAPMRRTPTRP